MLEALVSGTVYDLAGLLYNIAEEDLEMSTGLDKIKNSSPLSM